MSDQIQYSSYPRNRNLRRRRTPDVAQSQFQPPVCALCGNPYIRPFSAIYGRGTTFYTRIKGLILKHGYERTKRQSVLANHCSPPIRLPWSPALLVTLFFLGTRWSADKWIRISGLFDLAGYYLAWGALLLAVTAGVNNFGFYPQRMSDWRRSYFCDKCGGRTILER